MNRYIYEKLREQSEELGFQSVPDYIRYWAKAAIDGRTFSNTTPYLVLPEAQAIRFIELFLAARTTKPASLEVALDEIRRELVYISSTKVLQNLGLH